MSMHILLSIKVEKSARGLFNKSTRLVELVTWRHIISIFINVVLILENLKMIFGYVIKSIK